MANGTNMDPGLRYDRMVEDALRGVVREALEFVAANGFPGEHHFYVTFRTDYPGVEVPDHLRERYPTEMTIVLQHQFWGLEVTEDVFSVSLSFNDQPETLVVPFDSVVAFADPAVRFGLQFEAGDGSGDEEGLEPAETANADEAVSEAAKAENEEGKEGDEKIVTLDEFRKKQS